MGVSTDGEISYGILLEEDFEFPWDDERYEGEIEEWWRVANGYTPPFELHDERGEYLNGQEPTEVQIRAYFDAQDAFDKAHPLSVELVNVQSHDYPAYIIAAKGTVRTANRGYPKAFNPADLVVTDEQRQRLIDFCVQYDIDTGGAEPAWYLSSYWG